MQNEAVIYFDMSAYFWHLYHQINLMILTTQWFISVKITHLRQFTILECGTSLL